ncbi:MAG TPA: hypothetical protein VJV05_07495 [Pyrinomonadaceae bacterium]|nr:hypothetical protein [Pyrinomonadaceae bacterium]
MRKPNESLDEFSVRVAGEAAEPPRMVTLHFGGDVEVLKPLVRRQAADHPDPVTGNPFRGPAPNRFSWFQSAMAAAAVLGIMLVILLSAIFIGVSDPAVSPDIAHLDTFGDATELAMDQSATYESVDPEINVAENPTLTDDEIAVIRPTVRRAISRRVRRMAYRPRRQVPAPQITVSTFVPTTLIIYPENGEIKSRIEPQIAAVYKRPLVLSN